MNMNAIVSPAEMQMRRLETTLTVLADVCHGASKAAGWYTNPRSGKPVKRNLGEMLCLIHSEISEAAEASYSNADDDKLPHRKGVEVELADALIRIGDYAGYRSLDVAGAVRDLLDLSGTPSRFLSVALPVTNCPDPFRLAHSIQDLVEFAYSSERASSKSRMSSSSKRFNRAHIAISNAMEGERKGATSVHFPSRSLVEVSLARAVLVIACHAGYRGFDLGGAVVEKLAFNAQRADHKIKNRRKAGGKKW